MHPIRRLRPVAAGADDDGELGGRAAHDGDATVVEPVGEPLEQEPVGSDELDVAARRRVGLDRPDLDEAIDQLELLVAARDDRATRRSTP